MKSRGTLDLSEDICPDLPNSFALLCSKLKIGLPSGIPWRSRRKTAAESDVGDDAVVDNISAPRARVSFLVRADCFFQPAVSLGSAGAQGDNSHHRSGGYFLSV